MKKSNQLTFLKASFAQYQFILEDNDIQEKIAAFLLKYVSVEALYKKLLIAYKEKDGIKISRGKKKSLTVNVAEMERVLLYFDVPFYNNLVDRIFGSNDTNYMDCSVKKLRDRLVHNVNENILRAILERYDSIDSDLNEFIKLFFAKR